MNICLLTLEWPPYGCGIATYMFNLARGLRRLGHSVTVITNDKKPLSCDGVKITHVPVPSFKTSLWYKIQKWRMEPSYSWSTMAYESFIKLCENEKFDIIETAEFGAWARHFVGHLNIPIVVRCHTPTHILWSIKQISNHTYRKPLWLYFQDRYERDQTARADAIISPSHALANHLSLSWVIPRSLFTVLANPIDSELFCPGRADDGEKNEILYIGRLEYNKGVFDLAEAVEPLLKEYPELMIRLVGMDRKPPPNFKKKESTASKVIYSLIPTEYHSRIIFTNHIPVTKTICFQQKAICTVMPTRSFESFSYTTMEAMSCGCPVIATECGGPSEIITDGFDGLLIPPGDVKALRDALERLIKDKQLREKLAFHARGTVECRYSNDVVVPEIIRLYENVISNYKAATEKSDTELCKK